MAALDQSYAGDVTTGGGPSLQGNSILGAVNINYSVTNNAVRNATVAQADELILQTLDYDGREDREAQIELTEAEESTFAWAWEHHGFNEWLKSTEGIFWIQGKPGSGKSTLMNYLAGVGSGILQNRLQSYHPPANRRDRPWSILRFYFDFRAGKDLPNNLDGLTRALCLQIYRQIAELRPLFDDDSSGIEIAWSQARLRTPQLRGLLRKIARASTNLLFLVDGLDESEDLVDVVRFLKKLTPPADGESTNCKICLASRPDKDLDLELDRYMGMKLQDANVRAISAFVDTRIDVDGFKDMYGLTTLGDLRDNLVVKAEGIFMWARFAADEIRRGIADGQDMEKLNARLVALPPSLQEVFERVIARMDSRNVREAHLALQLIFAWQSLQGKEQSTMSRNLTLPVLAAAVKILLNENASQSSTDWQPECLRFKQLLSSSLGGLLDFVTVEPGSYTRLEGRIILKPLLLVKFTHETVRTFLEAHYAEALRNHSWASSKLWLTISGTVAQRLPLQEISSDNVSSLLQLSVTKLDCNELKMLPRELLNISGQTILNIYSFADEFETQNNISSYTHALQYLTSNTLDIHRRISTTICSVTRHQSQVRPYISEEDFNNLSVLQMQLMFAIRDGRQQSVEDLVRRGAAAKDPTGSFVASNFSRSLKNDEDRTMRCLEVLLHHEAIITISTIRIAIDNGWGRPLVYFLQHVLAHESVELVSYVRSHEVYQAFCIRYRNSLWNDAADFPSWSGPFDTLLVPGVLDINEHDSCIGGLLHILLGNAEDTIEADDPRLYGAPLRRYAEHYLSKGYKLNCTSSRGTELDLLWLRARGVSDREHLSRHQELIRLFIGYGAILDGSLLRRRSASLSEMQAWCDMDWREHLQYWNLDELVVVKSWIYWKKQGRVLRWSTVDKWWSPEWIHDPQSQYTLWGTSPVRAHEDWYNSADFDDNYDPEKTNMSGDEMLRFIAQDEQSPVEAAAGTDDDMHQLFVSCDSCMGPCSGGSVGSRYYHCLACENFDICESCWRNGYRCSGHTFMCHITGKAPIDTRSEVSNHNSDTETPLRWRRFVPQSWIFGSLVPNLGRALFRVPYIQTST